MKLICGFLIASIFILSIGCNGDSNDSSSHEEASLRAGIIEGNTVEVYKYDGSVMCYGGGEALDIMSEELTDSGIPVVSAYCDTDGYYRIKACGAKTGNINVYEIYEDDFKAAVSLGFCSIDQLTDRCCGE